MDKRELGKLNEKMLEFAGWERLDKSGVGNPPQHKGKDFQAFGMNLPNFPSDLTACFHPEWGVVRKLADFSRKGDDTTDLVEVTIEYRPGLIKKFFAKLRFYHITKRTPIICNAETPALALCLAVEKFAEAEAVKQEGGDIWKQRQ